MGIGLAVGDQPMSVANLIQGRIKFETPLFGTPISISPIKGGRGFGRELPKLTVRGRQLSERQICSRQDAELAKFGLIFSLRPLRRLSGHALRLCARLFRPLGCGSGALGGG
jgi:hypothetical protein